MIYSPGDIVRANYTNMDGVSAEALFVVVYNEAIDSKLKHNRNLLVAKLTTNFDFYDCYGYTLSLKNYPFLPKACYVRSNKLNVLDTMNVSKFLGSLNNTDRMKVVKKFSNFSYEVTRQNKIKKIK